MDRAISSCFYFVCIFSGLIFSGLPSASYVGLVTTHLTATSTRVFRRSATALTAHVEGAFAEGLEVTLLAPPALAGTKATIVELVNDEFCQVQLPGGGVFKIPVRNLEAVSHLTKKPELENEAPALAQEPADATPSQQSAQASLKKEQEDIFEEASPKEEQEQEQIFEEASLKEEEEESFEEEQEELFAEGQRVILLLPPVLAGTSGTIVGVTGGGDYAVQLPSGSVFLVRRDGMKTASASGGGAGAGAGGSGAGYGGGSGLPPRRTGSNHDGDEPERSKAGASGLLVKLVLLPMLFCAIFYRLLRWMLQNLPRKKPDAGLLRQVDRLPAKLAGTSNIGTLVVYLCLALIVVFPEILAWFKDRVIALMSKAETVAESVQHQADLAGNTEDKWIAMWPLAVLVLAIILWRTGKPDDKEPSTSSNQYSLKYDGLSLKDINQYLFKAELRQRLHEHGVVRSKTEKLNIELRSGSVIALIRGPVDIVRSVKAINAHKLRVMGIAPKSWRSG